MRRQNIAILISLLLIVSVVFGCNSTKNQPTPTPQPTVTSQPTATPKATNATMDGWKKFTGDGIEIWLPDTFVQANASNTATIVFSASEILAGNSLSAAGISITREQVPSYYSIEAYLDAAKALFPSGFHVIDSKVVLLGDRQTGQMVVDTTISDIQMKEVFYVFKQGNTMWGVIFATSASEFAARLPDFEKSAGTFTVLP